MRGRSIQKWRIKIIGAGKIDSHRVLTGRDHNTLQGRTTSKGQNVENTRAGGSIGMQQERGEIDTEIRSYDQYPKTGQTILHLPQLEANRFNQLQNRHWRAGDHFNKSGGILGVQEEVYKFIPCTSNHWIRRILIYSNLPYLEQTDTNVQQLFLYQAMDEIRTFQAIQKNPRRTNEIYKLIEVPKKEPDHKLSYEPTPKWKPKSDQSIVQVPKPMEVPATEVQSKAYISTTRRTFNMKQILLDSTLKKETVSRRVDCTKGNTPEVLGTSNGTYKDVECGACVFLAPYSGTPAGMGERRGDQECCRSWGVHVEQDVPIGGRAEPDKLRDALHVLKSTEDGNNHINLDDLGSEVDGANGGYDLNLEI
ncbi:uncharacterized protein LOC117134284 [Brassica rapa]|uniref:Uncharacterized protein n=2 Tax=Brassica campestris TaxID=3711 RepID=M4FEW4_BRACM|nr:uncharacterized protein LOC117134284 [Brassica rapa]XP_048637134.1 uncharacterized protein LOC125609642 [Brassica napus]QDV59699.1 Phototropin 1b [Brassica rapa subsp. pekinensis]